MILLIRNDIGANWSKFFKKDVSPVKDKTQQQLDKNLAKSDDQATDFLTKQNQDNADYAMKQYNNLNTKLLTVLGNNTKFMENANSKDVQ